MLMDLFLTFFVIGFVSFGGGYAMIPLIQEEVVARHQWMNAEQFADVIAVAGMSPGPIATNSAIFIGYQKEGVVGALVASVGMLLPSLILILAVGIVFAKVQQSKLVKSSFYGLRCVITGLIVYAAILFATGSGITTSFSWFALSQILIFLCSLIALIFYRKHPVVIILISGLVGIAIY